ncbi:MAG: glycerol kinase GlpK, partial [Cyanobacteria bacterium]|nr:glycerol kinase GlpK [Cyanobacteriota bacterium]
VVLVLDHGTTGVRACLINEIGAIIATGYQKITQSYPQPGWVEQDPLELWSLTLKVCEEALQKAKLHWESVVSIGITNQRETCILWNPETGVPVYPAIVWQCRRTAAFCDDLKQQGLAESIQQKTGLVIDPYFSASKVHWLFQNVPEVKTLQSKGNLLLGTVDTWILWHLSGKALHLTDPTNASRTQLFNIHTQQWDSELLSIFNLPETILPQVKGSGEVVGTTDPKITGNHAIPIAGIIGDQQAALYGQKCWEPGQAKSTYGTGAFLMMNLGQKATLSPHGLLTTIGSNAQGNPCYAMEGAIFTAGATIEWIQENLQLIDHPQELDPLAQSLSSNEGVYLVPAFAGLGAPHWDSQSRGALCGLTQGAGKAHIVRAALEAMAYQTKEVFDLMQNDAHLKLSQLRVDGGVTRSGFLMQFLADLLNMPVVRAENPEFTALGAGYLSGLSCGFWKSPESISALPEQLETFEPMMKDEERQTFYQGWLEAVEKVLTKA